MKQSRLMSMVEAIANVVVGYGIAMLTQLLVFPWFGLPARIGDALAIGAIFTGISIARSFVLRRLFEALRMRRGTVSEWLGRNRDCLIKRQSDRGAGNRARSSPN